MNLLMSLMAVLLLYVAEVSEQGIWSAEMISSCSNFSSGGMTVTQIRQTCSEAVYALA